MASLTSIASRTRTAQRSLWKRARGRWWVTSVAVRRMLGLPPPDPIGQLIFEFARTHPGAFVVQIGAHDGSQLDPIRRYIATKGWRGILVEPQPDVFERLRANYAGICGLTFENVAIAPREGTMTLHYLEQTSDEGLPAWYDALASLRKEVLLSHKRLIPDIEARVRTMEVPGLTFDQLCARHGVTHIDVVQIDTEGFDFEILKLIDLDRFRPALIQLEELHMDDDTRKACVELMASHGYESMGNGMDRLCLHPERLGPRGAKLLRLWRRLRARAPGPA